MDALALILRLVREAIEASGALPDALQAALEAAEPGLPNALISQRLGVTDRYVRRVVSQLRTDAEPPA